MLRNAGYTGFCLTIAACLILGANLGCKPAKVSAPNLSGLLRTEAEAALVNVGLVTGVVSEAYSDNVAVGRVISQNPAAGDRVARGAAVDLVLSLGPMAADPPVVAAFSIAAGAASTASRSVTLDNTCTDSPTEYQAGEAANFAGASWQPYSASPSFTLSSGNGSKTVYFKTRNVRGESNVVSDTIILNITAGAAIVTLDVKENANAGADGYPVGAVIPLPRGQFIDPATLGIVGVPSQVEVLNRWPDNSLRHVLAHFQTDVAAHGDAAYTFAENAHTAPATPVTVTDDSTAITVATGPLRFTVSKTAFNIFDEVWRDANANGAFTDDERIIQSNARNGGVFAPRPGAGGAQYDAARPGPTVTIEEAGPVRAVIRVEAPASFESTTNHTHGFAVRIYAYAGKSYVKVDYQLENSAKNVVRSWPLYFESLNLDFRLNLGAGQHVRFGRGDGTLYSLAEGAGGHLAQQAHNRFAIYGSPAGAPLYDSGAMTDGAGPEGLVDVNSGAGGVMAAIRNFWQTWPNGLAVSTDNRLSLQLFPDWSAQWQGDHFNADGLYWLEDMQHVYKETMIYFHGPGVSDGELIALAKQFQYYPTAIVPTDWYRQTRATLDLGGVIPPDSVIPSVEERRLPFYHTEGFDLADWYDMDGPYYGAGWINFFDPEPGYRTSPCVPGGWPYAGAQVIATACPGDLFEAEAHGQSEINLRSEWMAQYTHDADWPFLQLSENPYCGGRWRIFEGNGVSKLAAPPLPNTSAEEPLYGARDDQHGWFYHVAESYLLTGNPWIRDWYGFVAEFRRTRLERLELFPDTSSRATGHALNHLLQAYRVNGDTSILTGIAAHLRTYLRPDQDPLYGDQRVTVEESGGGFQTGYLMRAIVDYLDEVRLVDGQAYAEGFNYLSGLMEWNLNFGNFPYYFNARDGGEGQSSGTGLTLVDPQAWYYWHTGKQAFLEQVDTFMAGGINGGELPYGAFNTWGGQFEGRYYLYVKNTPRADTTPPPAITDLTATRNGNNVDLGWTAPPDAVRYHVVWSTKPITAMTTTSAATANWWAANVVGPTLAPVPGAHQTISIATGGATPVYVGIFTFDASDNMSALSNVALSG